MSRVYAELGENTGFDSPRGGIVRAGEGDILPPELVAITPTGTAFGPIYLGVPDDEIVTVESLSFGPGEDSSVLPILGGAGVLAATNTKRQREQTDRPEEKITTRRGAMALLATAIGVAAAGTASADDDDLITLQVATLDISGLSGPLSIRVLNVVDEVLPPTTDLFVDARETRVGEIASPDEGVLLPETTDGEIRIYLEDTIGNLAQLFAWIRSLLPTQGDMAVEYKRELPQNASEYEEGEFVRMTELPGIVDAVAAGETHETILQVGNTQIPHDEDTGENDERGSYRVFDEALVYVAGSNPPAASEWTIRTQLGLIERTQQRLR